MLQLHNLSFCYRDHPVLHDIDIVVQRGVLCGVVGVNGSGKSTLMRLCAALLKPTHGDVLLDGKSVGQYPTRRLAHQVAYMAQRPTLIEDFSAFDTVMMARNPYQRRMQNDSDEDIRVVEESMRITSTWHLRDHRMASLSGGECQRVMLARAMAQQTPILMLDEPLANLDVAHQFETMRLLCQLNDSRNTTILVVMHDLAMTYQYCKYTMLLHQGTVMAYGPTHQVLSADNIRTVFGVEAAIQGDMLTLRPKE